MRPISFIFVSCTLLNYSLAQRPTALPAQVPVIRPKPGAWDTLKVVNKALTPNDARNFGVALPIGNGRLGAKVVLRKNYLCVENTGLSTELHEVCRPPDRSR